MLSEVTVQFVTTIHRPGSCTLFVHFVELGLERVPTARRIKDVYRT
jgi:hypothetical protein